ncbi:MAG TPA: hypothetical protein VM487_05260, partial [Phycisphaerae bacterium]|nr:hypothetical protein [Phycisphaerae bacterium]
RLDELVARAKDRYGYDKIVAATMAQIEKYRVGFAEALAAFEAQSGQRLEVTLSTNGLGRSRVSTARKWLMDAGQRSLCTQYKVYVLTRAGIRLQVESSGILELNDWDARTRTAVCYARGETEITVNGSPLTLEEDRLYRFDQISLRAANISLECSKPGTVRRSGKRLLIDLRPRPAAGKDK